LKNISVLISHVSTALEASERVRAW